MVWLEFVYLGVIQMVLLEYAQALWNHNEYGKIIHEDIDNIYNETYMIDEVVLQASPTLWVFHRLRSRRVAYSRTYGIMCKPYDVGLSGR